MSKIVKETYDVTRDSVNDTLKRIKEFYESHPMPDEKDDPRPSVAINMELWMELFCKGWRDIEYDRDPYNYSAQMTNNCDKSDKTLRKYYNR